ncbi:Do family serine endopeptidase [Leadbettera azotonutricia]|uniref:Protease DegQ n=1 Tax=Leadbettera azotonutricia (strain ATCC BAA-888 / DSM 13862 / ZAS-9) TaxID=545695 RepID=F5Y7U7_LEAAZ|nr:Do family serine endopeptidase [Leadbettera azotonutricia]AEF81479.1 protease DegQ [Leadbettera azotonutricia ZAS-9]
MNLSQKLSSKKFFIFNLVLIGVIFGFSLAFLSFSCSTPRAKAQAQETPTVVIPQDALAIAEGLQTAFRSVSDKVLPSVVEIKTITVSRRQAQNFNGIPWEFFFGPRGNGQENSQPEREQRSQGLGSGIIVRQNKDLYYVLTNNHVVDGANEIQIATKDGKEYTAELVGKDSRRDLAMVSFKTSDFFPLAVLGNSDDVKVGDWAIAMGNPLGEQFSFSVTMGIVSAVGRTNGPAGNINDFIQTDAPINQGNSGGPLVNIRGEVVGINTWIASNNGGGSVGLGFAIPINNSKRTIDEFINSGSTNDGWLGVSLIDPDKDLLSALGIEGKRGALASQVFLGSPADKGGIRAGDFITHVDKKEVRSSTPLTQMVGDLRPGDKAVFTVIRDGASRDFEVKIEARTDEVAAENKKLWPGLFVVSLTDAVRTSLQLDKDAQGLYVAQVIPETPAAIIGLQRGDRITAINETPVKDIASFYKALREKTDKELWFTFIRNETTLDSLKFKR